MFDCTDFEQYQRAFFSKGLQKGVCFQVFQKMFAAPGERCRRRCQLRFQNVSRDANPYFSNLGDFLYVNRTEDGRKESDFSLVKNFFKRAKLREDLFQDLTFFTKYSILGDDRPDNVAHEVYGDSTLDWVVLISNNIIINMARFNYDPDNIIINNNGNVTINI